ncbi:hypothetical protein PVAND_008660 [Polypedilum vanderplanki]|uniref:Peptidase S1 domain-containing protein n=1 Tax=Polypedilum vanderplanki TaxID=319348 RepID=A0A9J6CAN4_POLVA|nr:hypothetical protein PVAND_008660 [Polypedilum vanderplanki]
MMTKIVLFVLLFISCDSNHLSSRILNGNIVNTIDQFPYQVAIFARRNNLSLTLSSGAIISCKFILTCAHCIKDSSQANIYYGMTSFDQISEENYQVINNSSYRIHPNYSTFKNDIAIMLTSHDIQFNDKIKPVRLPSRSEAFSNYEHSETLKLAAWGIYSNAQEISNNLLYANIQMLSTNECERIFGSFLITDQVICSQTLHCSGDSGSLLIDHNVDNDDFLAVGIASFANYETCTEGVNHASAYMRVASYLDFINEHTSLIVD